MQKKITIISIILLSLISISIYIISISKDAAVLDFLKPEKFTRLKNVHIFGKENKNRSWEIKADECWTGRDRNRSYFENVLSCTIYEDDYPIVKNLTARRIIANSKNRDIEVFKFVDGNGWLSAQIDFNRNRKNSEYSKLFADYIKYNPKTDKAKINGNITIIKGDLTIETEAMDLDLNKNVAYINQVSKYTKGDDIIIGQSAIAFMDESKVDISTIEVYQNNKMATANSGILDNKKNMLTLMSNVVAVIEKTEEALNKDSIAKIRTDDTKKALKEKTVITCDQLLLYFEGKNFTAKGNVLITQKGKKARSNFAEYDEENNNIIMTGNVFMEKENQWIKTQKIIVSVKDEAFHAIGQVETEFIIKKQ